VNQLSRRLAAVESRNITSVGEHFPIYWKRAKGSEVWDEDDKRYIDFSSAFGVASIGHSHPAVVQELQKDALIHGMGDVHPSRAKVELLEKLADLYGRPAKTILSLNGSDAVESALKTAVLATGRAKVIAFENAYHGLGYGALAVTWHESFRAPFRGQVADFVTHLPFGDLLRLEEALATREYGALIIEPIQGRGGVNLLGPGTLARIAEMAHEAGTLVIYDEIMTGFCRTGSYFAYMHEDTRPDILCVGKALGGGIPISAAIARADVMDAWPVSDGEAIHTSTFLGHPLACRVALSVIGVFEIEKLEEKSRIDGEHILRRLADFNPRGRGMMIGVPTPSAQIAERVATKALKNRLILLINGSNRDVITLLPPLTIPRNLLDEGLDILEDALRQS